jgi:adenosylcobinamide-phosphate synthase
MKSLAATAGTALDQLVGEPPIGLHPVARFGALMHRVERHVYADRRARGVAHTAVGVGVGVIAGLVLRRTIGPTAATIAATTICAAGRMLDDEGMRISRLLREGDVDAARRQVRSLVGRSTDHLDEHEISRAVIESVAENCVDAVTASLFWGSIGGAPAVLAHRSVNTLDAMVGHHDHRYERFGWASARLDDVANFLPARLTVLAVAAVRPRRAGAIWRVVRRDAHRHPSPNGGIIESAFAAALGVRLGGVNRYGDHVEDRGTLGDGPAPAAPDIASAVRLRRHATAIFALALVVIDSAIRIANSRRGHWAKREVELAPARPVGEAQDR